MQAGRRHRRAGSSLLPPPDPPPFLRPALASPMKPHSRPPTPLRPSPLRAHDLAQQWATSVAPGAAGTRRRSPPADSPRAGACPSGSGSSSAVRSIVCCSLLYPYPPLVRSMGSPAAPPPLHLTAGRSRTGSASRTRGFGGCLRCLFEVVASINSDLQGPVWPARHRCLVQGASWSR